MAKAIRNHEVLYWLLHAASSSLGKNAQVFMTRLSLLHGVAPEGSVRTFQSNGATLESWDSQKSLAAFPPGPFRSAS